MSSRAPAPTSALSPATLKTLAIPLPEWQERAAAAAGEHRVRARLAPGVAPRPAGDHHRVGGPGRARCCRRRSSARSSTKMAALQASFPAGYRVQVGRHGGGECQVAARRSPPALPLAALIMLIVLMVQLQSVSRLFLVLSVAPFGLIGVVLALLIAAQAHGVRGDPGHHRARGHDRAQLGDPGAPDRDGDRARTQPLGGGDRGHRHTASGRSCSPRPPRSSA